MSDFELKEVMEEIHISDEMQEEIVKNVQKRMKAGRKKTIDLKKLAVAAAVFVAAGVMISVPIQAVVKNLFLQRMESIPQDEITNIREMTNELNAEADTYSREYSDEEKARNKELSEMYGNGTFPEKTLLQVSGADGIPDGELCYDTDTGTLYLPDRMMTDEELLEIIDFNRTRSYAFEQSDAAKEVRAEMQAEDEKQEKEIVAAGGISKEEAIEIARNQMREEIGDKANGKELKIAQIVEFNDNDGVFWVSYHVSFCDDSRRSVYECFMDSTDGSIIKTVIH